MDHQNLRENSRQDAAKKYNWRPHLSDSKNLTHSSTPRSVQAYKRQCIPSDNYDDATDEENILWTPTATVNRTQGGHSGRPNLLRSFPGKIEPRTGENRLQGFLAEDSFALVARELRGLRGGGVWLSSRH